MQSKPSSTARDEKDTTFEQHYKVAELAKLWSLSYGTVLNRAKGFPGVVMVGNKYSRRRTRLTLSIPRSVAVKLHAELTGEKE